MRKISTLLMLFCAFVGTALAQVTELSQLSNDKIYALKSGRCFLLYSEANVNQLSTSTAKTITDAERVEDAINNPNQQFKIQNTEGVYYLYSVGAAKYVKKDGSLSTDPVDALEIHDVRANFPNYPWKLCIGGNGLNTQIPGQANTGIMVNSWTTADAGNTFQIVDIEEKPLFDALTQLSTMVNNAKAELVNKHKLALQTTDANAPFYLSGTQDADGNTISKAIDNNPSTIYGTTWGAAVGHLHYWQVDLADASNLEEFTFSYITRANGNDTPTKINVQGSTDGEAFTDIVVLADGLPTAGGSTYTSAKIVNEGYRYLRFEVPSTTNNYHPAGKEEVTIAIAEFSMIDTNLNNYSVSDKNKANAISAAEEVLNADNNTLKTVQDAIDAFNAALALGRCTVNYSFTYGGVERYTQAVETYVGEEYPEITVANQFVYGITAVKPTGVINADEVVDGKVTKTIELTDNLPFVAANSYAAITKWYYIQMHTYDTVEKGYRRYLQPVEGGIEWADSSVDAAEIGEHAWAFIGNPFDGFKLVNYAEGSSKAVTSDGETLPAMGDYETATSWVLTASAVKPQAEYFCFRYPTNNNYMNAQGNAVKYWTSPDNGSTMYVTECDPTVQILTVNYSYKYNGDVIYTQTESVIAGSEYPELNVALPFGVSASKPEGTVTAATANVDIEMVVNLPFEFAADYKSITKWYYIQMHSTASLTKYIQAVEGYIEWADASVNANEIDTYTWGFIGNPFAGFKLVNYGKGDAMGVNSNGSGNPAMGDIATATAWTIKPSASNSDAQYFCFQYPDSNQYMNAQSGKIAFWGSADNGSTMWVTERDLSGATELQAVIDQVEAFVEAGVAAGTTVGYLTSESVANVATALAAAKEAVATKTGCIEAQAALQAAVAAVETIQPEEGKFYVIASAMPETDARSGQKMYVNKDGYMHFHNEDALANVFQFEKAENGEFYLVSVENGAYLNTAKAHNGGQATTLAYDAANAKSVAISNMGKANNVKIVPNGGAMLHAQATGAAVVAWNNTDAAGASAWTIEEVNIEDFTHTVSVTEAGWATLYLGYNAEIPEGVTAYAVSSVDAESANLEEVKNVLPANTAVLLNATAGDYNFDFTAETAEVANNVLRGTVFNTAIPEDIYVLGNGTAGVGFYKAIKNLSVDSSDDIVEGEGEEAVTTPVNDAVLNNAFKAYLPANGVAAQALRFNFGGTTAIESVVNGINANAAIYDLSGRRVEKATKGIYIVNGKKMIVK